MCMFIAHMDDRERALVFKGPLKQRNLSIILYVSGLVALPYRCMQCKISDVVLWLLITAWRI